MTFHTTQQRPPKSWDEFEELCLDIFRAVHGDPTAQKHGRRGQPQQGVDVYGRFSDRKGWWGIQCKGKEASYGAVVTEDELREEVEKAKRFRPELSHFTLATTAQKDAKIEAVARAITQENEEQGLFEVQVLGWDDLQSHISRYPEVIEKHYPSQGPLAARLETGLTELPSALEAMVRRAVREEAQPSVDTKADPLDARIDLAKDLIAQGQPRSALKALDVIDNKVDFDPSPRLRFRILANKGNAHHAMGNDAEAASLFIAAADADTENKYADLFRGLGILLKGDAATAADLFRAQLSQQPDDLSALEGLIVASTDNPEVDDPFSMVPSEYSTNSAILAAIARFYRGRGDHTKAVEFARAAHEAAPNDPQSALELGCLLLEPVVESPAARHGRLLTESEAAAIEEAENLFETIWRGLDHSERPRHLVPTAANLAAIYRFTDRDDDALKVIDAALAAAPGEPHLTKHKAVQLAVRGDRAAALETLSAVEGGDAELKALQGDLLSSEGKFGEALAVLREVAASDDPRWTPIATAEIPVVMLRDGDAEGAESEARRLVSEDSDSFSGYLALAEVLLRTGRPEQAKEVARSGLANIDDCDVGGRVRLADVLFRLDDWESSADALLPFADGKFDTPLLRQLLSALYNADRRAELGRLLHSLPGHVAASEFYVRLKAAYFERVGELERAKEAFEEAIALSPVDLGLRIHWLQCTLQMERADEIKEFLSGPLDFPDSSTEDIAHLLQWADQFGDSEAALKAAYDLRRQRYDDPAAHRALISLLLFGKHGRKGLAQVDEVNPNVAVRLVQEGSDPQTIILESGEEPNRTRGEIAADSETARRLLGARRGDIIELHGTGLRSDRWVVEDILPKEVHAFRISLSEFNNLFPEEQWFIRVNTDPENMEPAIEEMAKLTSGRGEFVKRAAGLYQEMPLPIAVISKLVGHSVVDTWLGLASSGELVQVASGLHEEREKALEIVRSHPLFVIDALTLYILDELGVAERVVTGFGPFAITWSSILLLEQVRHEKEESAGKELTVAEASGGRLSLRTYSKEATQAAYNQADRVLRLARRLQISPAEANENPSQDMRGVGSFMHSSYLDTVICAKGVGGALLCEDLRIRQWADDYLAGRSVWVQPLLMVARDEDVISKSDYARCTIKLISLGHAFVSVDNHTLMHAAERLSRVNKEFELLINRLSGPNVEIQSLTGVLASFLSDLWSSDLGIKKKVKLTRPVSRILFSRWGRSQRLQRALLAVVLPTGGPRAVRRAFERGMKELYRD